MSDIFISYDSADRPRVKHLVDELHRRGWSVWWDRTVRPGQTYDKVIDAALSRARCVIVLWSRESVESDWVKTEAAEAKSRGILVPALLDVVKIPLEFRRIHAANLVDCSGVFAGAEFEGLVEAVAAVLGDDARQSRRWPDLRLHPAQGYLRWDVRPATRSALTMRSCLIKRRLPADSG